MRAVTLILCLGLASFVMAQEKITLRIGDQAPPMQYSKWIKGEPVKAYEKNRLYVLEFWATWCGPCKAVMPHLSELARKYSARATFVGVNVWEKTGDKPYETSLPAVARFVNSIGDKMAYNVIADNNEQFMGNKWMKAAGQYGIPSTFLLKEGQIIWIGHPIKLDSIIDLVLSGKYDMVAYRNGFEEGNSKSAAMANKFTNALKPINEAIAAKEYQKAFSMIDKAIPENPMLALPLKNIKYTTLLNQINEEVAISYAKEWIRQNKNVSSMVASVICEKDSLSKSSYDYAAGIFREALAEEGSVKPIINHYLATCYSKAGDISAAISAEEKAIEEAKIALKEGKWLGTILDYTVKEYEEALAKYKNQQSVRA